MIDKTCGSCKKLLPISSFYLRGKDLVGHMNRCKICMNINARAKYAANAEKERARSRAYNAAHEERARARSRAYGELHREEIREREKKYRAENAGKGRARCTVGHALRNRKISRPGTCSLCGAKCKPDAHHGNYSKPLEIEWLCRGCHMKKHRKGYGYETAKI